MRNTRVLTILTLAGCVVAACNAGELADSGPRDVEAILIFYGDTSRIIAPDTVVRGATFDVTFTTFAGGCRRRVAYDGVVTAPGILEIRPYDHVDGGSVCTDDQIGRASCRERVFVGV